MKLVLLSFLFLVRSIYAYTVFEPSCSTPSSTVNFVSAPDSRGTLDILWSSLFTIIACTWTIQHPNIPEQRCGRDPGWKGDLKWRLKGAFEKAKWMVIAALAPEIIVISARSDQMTARKSLSLLEKFARQDEVPWTLTHSYFANMGGFAIKNSDPEDMSSLEQGAVEEFYNGPYFHLNADGLFKLRHGGFLEKLPFCTEEELLDKSKSDSMVKTIAIIQISWSVIGIIARAARQLPISQLEIATVAFAICALIIYLFYWNKPHDVHAVVEVQLKDINSESIPDTVSNLVSDLRFDILRSHSAYYSNYYNTRVEALEEMERSRGAIQNWMSLFNPQSSPPGSPIRHDNVWRYDEDIYRGAMRTGMAVATVFGAIHLLSWNSQFPTTIERIIWRYVDIYLVLFGLLGWLDFGFPQTKGVCYPRIVGRVWRASVASLYVIGRLYILVEVFRSLCFLPPEAFVATWSSSIPHFG